MFLEWCLEVTHRNGTFLPAEVVNSRIGFRSVYGFLDKPKSSKGLIDLPVISDTLFLDFDTGFQDANVMAHKLRTDNISFFAYTSGSKGVHIEIPIVSMTGVLVPYSQECFVKREFMNADLSLYRASSLIRLPGTKHAKTGNIKSPIDVFIGNKLSIPLLSAPPKPKFQNLKLSESGELINAIGRLDKLLNTQPTSGNRSITLWSLASTFARAGISFDTCLELCYELNNSWKEPKEAEVVLTKVKEAYNK